jgi:GTP-binding protein HflX
VESFKSTLAEVKDADILLHVVDISNLHYMEQMKVVRNTLADIKAADKPTIIVFNKIDGLDQQEIDDLEKTWMYSENYPAVFISAYKKLHIEKLRNQILELVKQVYKEHRTH